MHRLCRLTPVLTLALLGVLTVVPSGPSAGSVANERGAPATARRAEAAPNTHTSRPTTGLFYNIPSHSDSDRSRAHVSKLYVERIRGAAHGSTIRVFTWIVTDQAVVRAMRHVHKKKNQNVKIQVLTSRANCKTTTENLSFLHGRGSWVRCIRGHGMHQKSMTFSRTGGVSHVTLVGSSNIAASNYRQQWNDMFQYAGRKDVYGWYVSRFATVNKHRGNPDSVHYQTRTASDGRARATFLPIDNADPGRRLDPVWVRLNNLPINPGGSHPTQIRIAMYAMDKARGDWLVDKLAFMSNHGANIRFVAGQYVRSSLKTRLRNAGVKVVNGYTGSCTPITDGCEFVHLKMMTAKYYSHGIWNYRSYTGSENWAMANLTGNFEATQRMGGSGTWAQFNQLFTRVWRHYS